jgi:phenylpropionate dioxygenase-like ring-hydroxylating dioxygenase large terminal subunit
MAQTTTEQSFDHGPAPRTGHLSRLDKERYTSSQMMAAEWESVWTRCWLFAGLVSDIPEAGDFFLYEVGRESIVVLRDEEGQIGAFYNVCQHRGNRLLTSTSGAVVQLACPYHGWRYSLDGQLQEVPDAERFCPAVQPLERSLKPVRVEVWAGLVWINLDPEAGPLNEFLGVITANLEGYHFEDMVLAAHQTVALDANWKVVRDNFLEQYHVDFIHPQHATLVDCCNSENVLWPYGHSSTMVQGYVTDSRYPLPEEVPEHLVALLQGLAMDPHDFRGKVDGIREAVQLRKRELASELGFQHEDLTAAQLSDVWQYDIFPNTFMKIQAEELWIFGPRPHPTDPNKCFLDKFTLQIPLEVGSDADRGLTLSPSLHVSRADERPERESFTAQDVIEGRHSMTITIDQDIYYLADMQAGLQSRGFDHATLNMDEIRVQHFHDWVDECIRLGKG